MKTTPTPWTFDGYNVSQPSGRYIAYTGPSHTPDDIYPPACKAEDEANAEFIARVVNSHGPLVNALENMMDGGLEGPTPQAIDMARAALALATGKKSA